MSPPKRPGTLSDDDRAPLEERSKRHQSQTERDLAGFAARRERQRSGVPEFADEECTGRYEGEDLARARARRPTPERIDRIEKKQDEDRDKIDGLASTVNTIRVDVAGMRGELKVLPKLIELIEGKNADAAARAADEHKTKRLGMTNRTKIILGLLGLLGSGGLGAVIAALAGRA